jgi:uncharacterized membrane protein
MTKVSYQQANRRYLRLFVPAMALYAVAVIGGVFLVSAMDNQVSRVVAGLAAGLPLVVATIALLRFARETDDFNRQANFEAMGYAGAMTASAAALVGFLQMYDVLPLFPAFWFVVFYFPAYGFSFYLTGKAGGCAPDAS